MGLKTIFFIFISIIFTSLRMQAQTFNELNFIENKGQWNEEIKYKAQSGVNDIYINASSIKFNLIDPSFSDSIYHRKMNAPGKPQNNNPLKIKGHSLEIKFNNANIPYFESKDSMPYYLNYYCGNNPDKWATNIHPVRIIRMNGLYDGIDALITSRDGNFAIDFYLSPHAKVRNISFSILGTDKIKQNDSIIIIPTTVGDLTLKTPRAFQNNIEIPIRYKVKKNNISFDLPEGYDKNSELFIDPDIMFCSYSGATTDNWGYTATYDREGFLYTGGNSFGMGYPTTLGAYDTIFNGNVDAVVSKYDTTGSYLIYSTYLGGSGYEVPISMVTNDLNELYVLTITGSSDYPYSTGCYDSTFNGGTNYTLTYVILYPNGSDLGITAFSPDGTGLISSTYLGGTGNDGLNAATPLLHNYADDARGEIILGRNNEVYVAGSTYSNDFPVTANSFQPTPSLGQKGFVTCLDRYLSQIIWSSYFDGGGHDAIYSIFLGRHDDIYIAGGTTSNDLSTSSNAIMPNFQGNVDGFVARISNNGAFLNACTYFGTPQYDQVFFVRTDKYDNVYIYGQSNNTTNLLVQNAGWYIPSGGQFITKLNKTLNTIQWSTRFGTSPGFINLSPSALTVDYCNNIYLSGWGGSLNQGSTNGLPITSDAFQTTTDGNDFYFLSIDQDATTLLFASYFGGNISMEHVDGGTSRFDRLGRLYQSICAGCGSNSDLPTTPGAWSNTNNSFNCNNGVVKIDFHLPAIVADFIAPNIVCLPDSVHFVNNSHIPSTSYATYHWDFGDGFSSNLKNPTHYYSNAGVYTITLIVSDITSCNGSDTMQKIITVLNNTIDTLSDIMFCLGQSANIGITSLPAQGLTYLWTPSDYLSNPNISDPIANPPNDITYTLLITGSECSQTFIQHVNVIDIVANAGNDTTICTTPITLYGSGSGDTNLFYIWSSNINFTDTLNSSLLDNFAVIQPTSTHTYYLQVSNGLCYDIDSVKINLYQISTNYQIQNTSCYDICDGSATVEVDNAHLPVTFNWSNGADSVFIDSLCAGTYYITITDAEGCIKYDSLLIDSPQQLIANIVSSPETCPDACNGSLSISASGGTPPYSYLWSNGFNSSSVNNLCVGEYVCTVTDANNCKTFDSDSVILNYIFIDAMAWVDHDTIYEGQSTSIHSTYYPNVSYHWSPPLYLENPTIPSTIATPPQSMTYIIMMDDGNGCYFYDTINIVVLEVFCEEPHIFIPNSFTPNGDNLNDVLYVYGNYIESLHLAIYNRWGQKVFETNDKYVGWDGYYNGNLAPPGVYDYYLEVYCYNKEKFQKKGNITLLR
jgi:gliding motility-associated-like protein